METNAVRERLINCLICRELPSRFQITFPQQHQFPFEFLFNLQTQILRLELQGRQNIFAMN